MRLWLWDRTATVKKYYGLTDDSIVYHIAMRALINITIVLCSYVYCTVLHPRYKSTYFQKAGWPREWIQTAEDLLQKEWETNYKPSTSVLVQDTAVHFYLHHHISPLMMVHSRQQLKIGISMISIPLMQPALHTLLKSGWVQALWLVQMACDGGPPCPHILSIAWPWISCLFPVCFFPSYVSHRSLIILCSHFHRCREGLLTRWTYCFKNAALTVRWINTRSSSYRVLVWFSWCHTSGWDCWDIQGQE